MITGKGIRYAFLSPGVGLRFVRELEQGKETLRLDKVNQVLLLFGQEIGPVPIRKEKKTKYNEENTLITFSSCWLINYGLLSTGRQIGLISKNCSIGWHHRIGSTGLYQPGKGGYHQLPSRCPHFQGICRRSSGRCPPTGLPQSRNIQCRNQAAG